MSLVEKDHRLSHPIITDESDDYWTDDSENELDGNESGEEKINGKDQIKIKK